MWDGDFDFDGDSHWDGDRDMDEEDVDLEYAGWSAYERERLLEDMSSMAAYRREQMAGDLADRWRELGGDDWELEQHLRMAPDYRGEPEYPSPARSQISPAPHNRSTSDTGRSDALAVIVFVVLMILAFVCVTSWMGGQ